MTLETDIDDHYRQLAKRLHPDVGGSHDDWTSMQREYIIIKSNFKNGLPPFHDEMESKGNIANYMDEIMKTTDQYFPGIIFKANKRFTKTWIGNRIGSIGNLLNILRK